MNTPTQKSVQRDDIRQQMADMLMSYRVSQALRAYAELPVADHLATGPLTAAEIAQRERSAPETTFRLMRAGLTLGLLTMDSDDRFHSTPLLDTLRNDAPGSLRGMALGLTNRSSWSPWGEFVTAVRTGRSQAREVLGMNIFEYLQQNPEQSREVTGLMECVTSLWARGLAGALETSDVDLASMSAERTVHCCVCCSSATPRCAESSSTAPTSPLLWRPTTPAIVRRWSAAISLRRYRRPTSICSSACCMTGTMRAASRSSAAAVRQWFPAAGSPSSSFSSESATSPA